jgi:hypothetical protein
MSEKAASQAQQIKDTWTKMVDDHVVRVTAAWDEVAKLEGKGLEQAQSAVAELATMQKETLAYFGQLSAEWRKLGLEATKRTADFFTARA